MVKIKLSEKTKLIFNKHDNTVELVLTFNLLHKCGILTKKIRDLFCIFLLYLLKTLEKFKENNESKVWKFRKSKLQKIARLIFMY